MAPLPDGSLTRAEKVKIAILAIVVPPLVWALLPVSLGGRTGWTMVVGKSMEPTMSAGDLVITRQSDSFEIGDVVVYAIPDGTPGEGVMVIHRITGGNGEEGFITTGDNRDMADPWRPRTEDIIGEGWRVVPRGGWVIAWLRSPLSIGLFMATMVFMMTMDVLERAEAHQPRHARPPRWGLAPLAPA